MRFKLTKKRLKLWKQRVRRVAVVATIGVVAGFVLNILADNPYTHRIVRVALNQKVEELTDLKIDFRALKVSVMPPGVDLYGLNIAHKREPTEKLFSTSHVRLEVSVWSMFWGSTSLSEVSITDLNVGLPFKYSFAEMLHLPPTPENEPIPWPPPFRLPIDHLRLKNSSISVLVPSSTGASLPDLNVNVQGIDLTVDNNGWDNMDVAADVSSIYLAVEDYPILENSRLFLQGSFEDDLFKTEKLTVSTPYIDADGSINAALVVNRNAKRLDEVIIDIKSGVKGDLEMLGRVLDIPGTKGPVDGEVVGRFNIPLFGDAESGFKLNADVKSHGAQIFDFKLFDSTAKLTIDHDKIKFDSVQIQEGTRVLGQADGRIMFNTEVDFAFGLVPNRLPMSKLLESLTVDFKTVDFDFDGSKVRIEGKGDPYFMTVTGDTELKDVQIHLPTMDVGPPAESPDCKMTLDITVRESGLQLGSTGGTCVSQSSGEGARSVATGESSQINIGGRIGFSEKSGVDMHVGSTNVSADFVNHYFQMPMRGRGAVDVHVHGPFNRVLVDVRTAFEDFQIKGVPLGQLNAAVRVDNDLLTSSLITANLPAQGQLEVKDLKLRFLEDIPFSAKIKANNVPSAIVRTVMALPNMPKDVIFALKDVSADLEGELFVPLAYKGTVKGQVGDLLIGTELLANEFEFDLKNEGSGWSSDELRILLGKLHAHGKFNHKVLKPLNHAAVSKMKGWQALGLSQDDQIELTTKLSRSKFEKTPEKTLSDLEQAPFIGQYMRKAYLAGNISGDVKISGPIRSLQGTANLKVNSFSLMSGKLAPVVLNFILTSKQLEGVLTHAGNALEARMKIDLIGRGYPYELKFNAKRLDLRSVLQKFFYEDPRNFAYFTASGSWNGELDNFFVADGNIDVTDLRTSFISDAAARTTSMNLQLESPVKMDLNKGKLTIRDDGDLVLAGQLARLRLETGDNILPNALDLRISSELDVRLLSYVIPQIDSAAGKVRAVGSINGSIYEPQFRFQVSDVKSNAYTVASWTPVTIGIADFKPSISEIGFDALWTNDSFQLLSFQGRKGGGQISANGKLYFDENRAENSRIDINVNSASLIFPVPVLKLFDASLDGTMTVSGSGFPLKIAGDLNIVRARSISEFDVRKNVTILKKKSYEGTTRDGTPLFDFQLRINSDNSIVVANRNIQATMSANLLVTGNEYNPILNGQVEVGRGKFMYRRDFNINQAVITFDDPLRVDPKVDLTAYSDVSGYRVYITVTGRASDPAVDLAIDPSNREDGTPISKLAIIALLSSGSLPNSTVELSESRSAAIDEALSVVFSQFEVVGENMLDLLGTKSVQQVYLEAVSDENGKPTPQVTTPVRIGDDVDLVVRYREGNWNLSSEYSLHDNISVLGSFDGKDGTSTTGDKNAPSTDTGVDLRFKFSFP